MSNGTKTTSDLTEYTLQGGWDNTRMVFMILRLNVASGGSDAVNARIRHHTDRNNPKKYIEKFHIVIDGTDTTIDADEWYPADFARKVWDRLTSIELATARNKWVRV